MSFVPMDMSIAKAIFASGSSKCAKNIEAEAGVDIGVSHTWNTSILPRCFWSDSSQQKEDPL